MRMDGCGVRRSETAHLRIQHVNVDTGMLSIQFGKGGKARTVPLPHKIHGAIMRPFEKACGKKRDRCMVDLCWAALAPEIRSAVRLASLLCA